MLRSIIVICPIKERYYIILIILFLQARAESPTPFLKAHFTGQYPTSNIFDHNYPLAFADEGQCLLSWWVNGLAVLVSIYTK